LSDSRLNNWIILTASQWSIRVCNYRTFLLPFGFKTLAE
jgi:hypothetical protein